MTKIIMFPEKYISCAERLVSKGLRILNFLKFSVYIRAHRLALNNHPLSPRKSDSLVLLHSKKEEEARDTHTHTHVPPRIATLGANSLPKRQRNATRRMNSSIQPTKLSPCTHTHTQRINLQRYTVNSAEFV